MQQNKIKYMNASQRQRLQQIDISLGDHNFEASEILFVWIHKSQRIMISHETKKRILLAQSYFGLIKHLRSNPN